MKEGFGYADFGSIRGYFSMIDPVEAARGRECCSLVSECC